VEQTIASADPARPWRTFAPIVLLALAWGINWPVLKKGVTAMPPLTFRALTLPLAGLGMLLVARASGDSLKIPRAWWAKLIVLAAFNISGWNAFVLFGVQQLPSGRSAILAYTMPIWATLMAFFFLGERLSPRKLAGFALGLSGMAVLLGDDIQQVMRAPFGTVMILLAAFVWACGTVLLRHWKPVLPQTTLSGWMMLVGWIPIALVTPFIDHAVFSRLPDLAASGWFALLYNVLVAGTIANWIWFMLARTLPVAVSSLSSLPIPIVGVFSGMVVLGERPGINEWIALLLVVAALAAVMLPENKARTSND
jgi:drug/metabolite transporter (DMT)-like permease